MKEIKITTEQFSWLCAKLQETYREAEIDVQQLESSQSINYYLRNDAVCIRLRALLNAKKTMKFCKEFEKAII